MSRKPTLGMFAVVALLVLLAQPLCAAYHLPGHPRAAGALATATADTGDGADNDHSAGCCASVYDAMVVAPPAAVPSAFEFDLAVLPSLPSAPVWRSTGFSLPARAQGAPPPPKSYYARSARILS